jgi:uncharacterized protein (TIGR00255 family)
MQDKPGLPVRSMTGYARVRKQTSAGELTISLRSVNHRGLDLHFHQGSEFSVFENAMRALLKQRLRRGHVEVRVSLARDVAARPDSYNRDLLGRFIASFYQVCEEFKIEAKPDVNALLCLPGVLEAKDEEPVDAAFEPEILPVLAECIDQLNAFREREGAELRLAMEGEAAAIAGQTTQMLATRAEVLPVFHKRLQNRLAELLNGAGVDARRIAEEAAFLADRSDIQEELMRLGIHTQEMLRNLKEGGEVGKKLDFLLQEMNRETNTVLSKTSGADVGLTITNLALATKANIEKIREQALNLE